MLEIQKEIKEFGLDAVVSKYSFSVDQQGDLIMLGYNMIESDRYAEAVRECRGIILRIPLRSYRIRSGGSSIKVKALRTRFR